MSDALLLQLARRLVRPPGECERERARLHLLDWLACVAGARTSKVAEVARRAGGAGWTRAAWLGNVLEMDDIHRTALLHPGPVVWPAALSFADACMDERIDAAVRGYEAMIAVGTALDGYHYAHWHPTTTAGMFGAAAAAGSLLGAEPAEYVNALANAGSVAGGLWHMRHDDVLTKQWHIAHVVRTGREAALFARAGATGPARLLEGLQGLYEAMTRQAGELGGNAAGWLVHGVSFKPFAACRHAHPAIDAALELRSQGKLEAPFFLETFCDALTFCDRPDPRNEVEAKFSLQHSVAVIAAGRNAEPADFTSEAISDLSRLRAQVSVAEDPAITARYPAHFGARLNGLELVDTRGDPERPVAEGGIVAKLRVLAEWGGLGIGEVPRAVELALHRDDAEALDAMIAEWLA